MTFEAMCAMPAQQGFMTIPDDEADVTANRRLKALVTASMLPPAVAMTIFNRGMQAASACSETQWKRYLAEPGSERFEPLPEALLMHAIHQFARIGIHHRAD